MEIIDILTQSRKIFFECVDICNEKYRHGHDLQFYRDIISEHRKIADLSVLIASDDFLHSVRATLEKWDMNKRRAKLIDVSTMSASIRLNKDRLVSLYRCRLEELPEDAIKAVSERLSELFYNLKIMATKRRIVGVSKALHFLLPDLVMPVDSSNTMLAFYGYNRYDNSAEKEYNTFKDIFLKSYRIAKCLALTKSDVTDSRWSCSVPKLIDNAILGFFIKAKNLIKEEAIK